MPSNVLPSSKKGKEEVGGLGKSASFCTGSGWASVYPWKLLSDGRLVLQARWKWATAGSSWLRAWSDSTSRLTWRARKLETRG